MAVERRFRCTACGKCCHGRLPLSLRDALAHAHRFPLGVVWTPVRQGHRSYDLAKRFGAEVRTPDRKRLAVRVAPAAHIPPSFPCPALDVDGLLCGIHQDKPSRCRAMPFSAWDEEADQPRHLIPRAGWQCDTSEASPVVHADKRVVDRAGFEAERADLAAQAPVMRAYAEHMLATVPTLLPTLAQVAARPQGELLLSFCGTLLPRLADCDRGAVARAQVPVLRDFLARSEGMADFHPRYGEWITDAERLDRRFPPS